MAKTGLEYLVYKIDETKKGELADPITVDITINTNNQKLYAGNKVKEVDNSFIGGNIAFGIDDLPDQMKADVLGHTLDEADGVVCGIDDKAPELGIGVCGEKQVNNVTKYRGIWFPRFMFREPNETMTTRGESKTFGTDTITGDILSDSNRKWKSGDKTFDTLEACKTWLKTKAGITP